MWLLIDKAIGLLAHLLYVSISVIRSVVGTVVIAVVAPSPLGTLEGQILRHPLVHGFPRVVLARRHL